MEVSRGTPRVKNKQAAPVQISAEQLLRESVDRANEKNEAPVQKFTDLEELKEYQGRKRREFEDYVRRNRLNVHNWLRYAAWEVEQKDLARARSIFERAIEVSPTNVILWLRYLETEMKNRNINHARNLFDRVVSIMPRVDKFWYRYVYMEETLGNVQRTRDVFDRWMQWEPDEAAWSAYIKLEKRYQEFDLARTIFRKFSIVHPEPNTWLKWARFEEEYGSVDSVREVYGTAIDTLGDDFLDEKIVIGYAKFEIRCMEYERARSIYKLALDVLPRAKAVQLHRSYTQFEKQFGNQDGVEDVVLAKRRVQYQEQIKSDPKNYDLWFDYARLEESAGDVERARDVYEQAIAQVPASQQKRDWRRYIYLWIFYATWEEIDNKDADRARQVYDKCLQTVPHKKFTFAKIWLLKAHFEIRQGELQAARKALGRAIGMCPKDKLFRGYVELEMKLFEFGRCRTLYQKQLEWNPVNASGWIKFAELESGLDDQDRARAIFELAVNQDELDLPELVWKAYIDFEDGEGEYDRARRLYERLLQKTNHVKVWISYALFEVNVKDGDDPQDSDNDDEESGDKPASSLSEAVIARARGVFERAYRAIRDAKLKEERVAILNAYKSFERTHGTADKVAEIERLMPERVKKRRKLADGSFEEFVDYVFPDDTSSTVGISKLQQRAQAWRAKQAGEARERQAKPVAPPPPRHPLAQVHTAADEEDESGTDSDSRTDSSHSSSEEDGSGDEEGRDIDMDEDSEEAGPELPPKRRSSSPLSGRDRSA